MGPEGNGGGSPPPIDRKNAATPQSGQPEIKPPVTISVIDAAMDNANAAAARTEGADGTGTSALSEPETLDDIANGKLPPELGIAPSPDDLDEGIPLVDDTDTATRSLSPEKVDRQKAALKQHSEEVSVTLLDTATDKWKSGLELVDVNKLSDAEFQLYVYRQLKNGFPEESYIEKDSAGKVVSKGRELELYTDRNDVDVLFLTEGKGEGKDRVYTCTAKDPDDESRTITVDITGDELARRYLEITADDIKNNFSGSGQKLVEWYANGSKGDPPLNDEQLTAIEDSADPLKIADKIIDGQMDYLADKIATLKTSLAELVENDPNRAKIAKTIAEANNKLQQLDRTQALKKVEELGEGQLVLFAKTNTLRGVQSFAKEQGDQVLANGIETRLEELKPQLAEEREQFKKYLESKGVSPEVLALADEPDKLVELMNHPKIKALPDIMKTMFGTDEIGSQKLLNDYIDNIPFSDAQRGALKEVLAQHGKNALLALLIALAVGVGAVAIGGLGVAETVGGFAKAA